MEIFLMDIIKEKVNILMKNYIAMIVIIIENF